MLFRSGVPATWAGVLAARDALTPWPAIDPTHPLAKLKVADQARPKYPGAIEPEFIKLLDNPRLDILETLTKNIRSLRPAAKSLGVTRVALSRVLNGSAGISADMDLRLSKALGTTPGTWYAMQGNFDMWYAKRHFKAKVRPITKAAIELHA